MFQDNWDEDSEDEKKGEQFLMCLVLCPHDIKWVYLNVFYQSVDPFVCGCFTEETIQVRIIKVSI